MMGDACICLDTEGDYYDYDEQETTSDREQKCSECKRVIPVGAPHVVHLILEDEPDDEDAECEWDESHRECLCCASVRRSLIECGWYVGSVWSMIRDHMDYVMPIDEDDDGDESWLDEPTKPIGPNGW